MNSSSSSVSPDSASLADILPFLRAYKVRYFFGILVLILVDVLELIPPLLISITIDTLQGLPSSGVLATTLRRFSGGEIGVILWIFLGAIFLQWILRYLWRICFFFAQEYIARDIRRRYYYKLLELDTDFYTKAQTGELLSLASNDVDAVRMMMGAGFLLFVDTLCYFCFVLFLLISWNVELTFYLALTLPFLPFVVLYISRKIHFHFKKVQQQLAVISAHAQETFSGIGVIKNFLREPQEIQRFHRENQDYLRYNLDLAKYQSLFWPFMAFVVSLQSLLVLWIGGQFVQQGEMSSGELVGFIYAMWLLTWPAIALGWTMSMYQKGMASLGRLKGVLGHPSSFSLESSVSVVSLRGKIDFSGVCFTYPQSSHSALENITLRVEPGQTVALVGATGSGKSTLMRLLLRLYSVQEGEIRVDGFSVEELSLAQLRRSIGYMPQETFLFSMTVEENIAFGLEGVDFGVVERAARLACIHEEIEALPERYRTRLGEKGVNLSGGQKQRLALARTLAMSPPILVLDDCLCAVDPQTERRILANLRTLCPRPTILVSTHRLHTVQDADWIVVLEGGQILEQGTHDQLLRRGGWYAHTYRQQQLLQCIEGGPDVG